MKINEDIMVGNTGKTIKKIVTKHIVQCNLGTRNVVANSDNNANFSSSLIVGSKLSVSENKVVIGEDVSKIKINMIVNLQAQSGGLSDVSIRVLKNNNVVGRSYSYHSNLGVYYYATCVISNFILEVQNNDEISYGIQANKNYTLHDDEWGVSKLLIEVIE